MLEQWPFPQQMITWDETKWKSGHNVESRARSAHLTA